MCRNWDVVEMFNEGLIVKRASSEFVKGGPVVFDKATDTVDSINAVDRMIDTIDTTDTVDR